MEKRIAILGAGESGCGAAILAKKLGFDVFVSDFGTISDKYKKMLDEHGIQWEEKQHSEEIILAAAEVIKSPGIPNEAPMIVKIKEAGIPIISEIEFAGRYTKAKMVCITGSNGKTTTTSLIYHIFKKAELNTTSRRLLCKPKPNTPYFFWTKSTGLYRTVSGRTVAGKSRRSTNFYTRWKTLTAL